MSKEKQMEKNVNNKEFALQVALRIKALTDGKTKLTRREGCEDVLEFIGVPTHTREEVCREVFDE
jgi:hypothetical protein